MSLSEAIEFHTHTVNNWEKCVPDVVLRDYSENKVVYTKPQSPCASVTDAGTCIQQQPLSVALYGDLLQLSSLSFCLPPPPYLCLSASVSLCLYLGLSLSFLSVCLSLCVCVCLCLSLSLSTPPSFVLYPLLFSMALTPQRPLCTPVIPECFSLALTSPSSIPLQLFQTVRLSELKLRGPQGA